MTMIQDAPSSHILVTGATGFVGRALCRLAVQRAQQVIGCCRSRACIPEDLNQAMAWRVSGDLDGIGDWTPLLQGIDAIIHLAARVHVMQEQEYDPEAAYQQTNVEATLRLARAAVAAGVRRFVFVSTIKVHGKSTASDETGGWQRLDASSPLRPAEPYARSKLDAEQALRELAAQSGMELVIVRPPLVYGPGVGANFARLMAWVHRGIPLPLAAIDNLRSLVYVENLVDFLLLCARSPAAAGETFVISDTDVSTPGLIRAIATAMGRSSRLFPVPVALLLQLGRLSGRLSSVQRLCESLAVDSRHCRDLDGWMAPVTPELAMKKTCDFFLNLSRH